VKIVVKLPAELMCAVQPLFAIQTRHRRDSDRPCTGYDVRHPLRTF